MLHERVREIQYLQVNGNAPSYQRKTELRHFLARLDHKTDEDELYEMSLRSYPLPPSNISGDSEIGQSDLEEKLRAAPAEKQQSGRESESVEANLLKAEVEFRPIMEPIRPGATGTRDVSPSFAFYNSLSLGISEMVSELQKAREAQQQQQQQSPPQPQQQPQQQSQQPQQHQRSPSQAGSGVRQGGSIYIGGERRRGDSTPVVTQRALRKDTGGSGNSWVWGARHPVPSRSFTSPASSGSGKREPASGCESGDVCERVSEGGVVGVVTSSEEARQGGDDSSTSTSSSSSSSSSTRKLTWTRRRSISDGHLAKLIKQSDDQSAAAAMIRSITTPATTGLNMQESNTEEERNMQWST